MRMLFVRKSMHLGTVRDTWLWVYVERSGPTPIHLAPGCETEQRRGYWAARLGDKVRAPLPFIKTPLDNPVGFWFDKEMAMLYHATS